MYINNQGNDTNFWLKRWQKCSPYTYPPELYGVVETYVTSGWWLFKRYIRRLNHICTRCQQPISLGHMCEDLIKIQNEKTK